MTTDAVSREKPVPRFFLGLLVLATVLVGAVLRPVAKELLLAAVLASILWPLQRRLTVWCRGRRGVAAGVLTFLLIVLLLGPVATIVTVIISDGAAGVQFVSDTLRSEQVADLVGRLPASARDFVSDAIAQTPRDLGELVSALDGYEGMAAATVGKALAVTGALAFHGAMMAIALFFLLTRGAELVHWIDEVSPLEPGQTLELFSMFRRVAYAVVASSAVTAAVQAAAALVGYLIAGVPSPVFFALLTFFLAFIPSLGAAVVCLFASALLLLTGHPYMAAFLAVWAVLVVGLVDNLIKPLLIRRGLEIHGGAVFFSLVGGIAAFGAIGLIIGPMAVALFLAVLRMYHRDYSPGDGRVPPVPGLRHQP
ncbi:MAG: AI-2E family transporter [Kofleriaceae bacterium]|nr:AI-2E family transporter [Kofleriaceae bacterium]